MRRHHFEWNDVKGLRRAGQQQACGPVILVKIRLRDVTNALGAYRSEPLEIPFVETPTTDRLEFAEPLRERKRTVARKRPADGDLPARTLDFVLVRAVRRDGGENRIDFAPHDVGRDAGANHRDDLEQPGVARTPIRG